MTPDEPTDALATALTPASIDKAVSGLCDLHWKMLEAIQQNRPYPVSIRLGDADTDKVLTAAIQLEHAKVALSSATALTPDAVERLLSKAISALDYCLMNGAKSDYAQGVLTELREALSAAPDRGLADYKFDELIREMDSHSRIGVPEHLRQLKCADWARRLTALRQSPAPDRGLADDLIERSKDIFRSYDLGQNNVHDRQLLRDAIAYITTLRPSPAPHVYSDGSTEKSGKWSLADVGVTPHIPKSPAPGKSERTLDPATIEAAAKVANDKRVEIRARPTYGCPGAREQYCAQAITAEQIHDAIRALLKEPRHGKS